MSWFWLALCCAFSLASADAFTKRFLADYDAAELVLVRFGWTGLVLSPLLWFQPLPATAPPPFWGCIALLMPLELLAMLLYMSAIRSSPLALTLPYLAFSPVLTTLTGFLMLGERVSPAGFGGILLIVVGAYLLNVEPVQAGQSRHWLAPLRVGWREPGARLMLAVAAIYSVTSVLGKQALQYVPVQTFGPFYMGLLGLLTVLLFALWQPARLPVLWRRPGQHLLLGLLLAIMVSSHFLAVTRVEVAYMLAVKRTSLLFGILYGALLFHEPRLGPHLLAGGLMLAGVALITL
jgi:drug/metabolite transporter (DMT)-like permease